MLRGSSSLSQMLRGPAIQRAFFSSSARAMSLPVAKASTTTPYTTPTATKPTTAFPAATGKNALAASPPKTPDLLVEDDSRDWTRSFHGLGTNPFPAEVIEKLLAPLKSADVEIKPDGLLYLPEIKYRRILNLAFGPGGWGLAPRSEHSVTPRTVSREYALVAFGRFVSQARGEQDYFDPDGLPTASEGCKSNALMRCCKDLGIASDLWDPVFIRAFKAEHCVQVMTEHVTTKKRRMLWRKRNAKLEYPFKEV